MKKSLLYFLLSVGVIAIVGLLFYLFSNSAQAPATPATNQTNTSVLTNTTTDASINENVNGNGEPTEPPGFTYRVSATAEGFIPENLTIAAGDSVAWKNDSTVKIQVVPHVPQPDTDGSGSLIESSDEIAPGDEYIRTFTEAGEYPYHDFLNPSHTGTIIVE